MGPVNLRFPQDAADRDHDSLLSGDQRTVHTLRA